MLRQIWYCHLVSFCIFLTSAMDLKVSRPIGVSLTKKVLYDSSKDFTCFDGSKTIRFAQVNDEYCDCIDGSDEPGTSACPNGLFHCINEGYRPKNIPSSRVNDGICDCCDGSDEWHNTSLCSVTCVDLYIIAKKEQEKQMAEANEGYLLRQEHSKTGLDKKAERQKALADYESQMAQLNEVEKALLQEKEEIEARETQAKDERRKIMEEELARKAEEENLARGARSFAEMDTDKDASLTLAEFRVHTELDPDPTDGDFKDDEAMTFLIQAPIDLKEYMQTVWPIINTTFQTTLLPPVEVQEEPAEADDRAQKEEEEAFREEIGKRTAGSEGADEYPDDEDDEEEEEDDGHEEEDEEREEEQSTPPPPSGEELYYDEATRALIQEANEARDKYQKNQDEKSKIDTEISILRKALEMDFGPDEAFQALQFQCYDLNTLEYTYKLCPFDRTVQKPKNGGAETSLGRWGSWNGPDDFRYSSMQYDGGQGCWNGPSRSTRVNIRCGIEHKLLSVDEPSRCTYVMEFATPCACLKFEDNPEKSFHDEL